MSLYDASFVDPRLDSRAVSFENPTGGRGAGGRAHGGRKGAPSRIVAPGERVVLADLDGPGTLRHLWLTVPPAPPEIMRALWLDVHYDGGAEPSISVPCLDFFAVPHGRPVAYDSALTSVHEGRGFNTYFPMPFRRHVRVELSNHGARRQVVYFQIDYTLEDELPASAGYLHAEFRRENPSTMRRDFVVTTGLHGPGRFLGCSVGVRLLDEGAWYGEGELKIYRDGDREYPTICGTGLEDYVGSAWGMGRHASLYAGAPLIVSPPSGGTPEFVGFYRWHLADPVMFERELTVTLQQIGYAHFGAGQEAEFERYAASHPAAGGGWERATEGAVARGVAERVDDYCATSFVYCLEPQPVPRADPAAAVMDIGRLDYEQPSPFERLFS